MPFVLGKALKAICKWAAQLPHLEELNQLIDDKVLEDVVMALIKYPNVVDIAYYSVCCLASLSRMPRKYINYHIRKLNQKIFVTSALLLFSLDKSKKGNIFIIASS